MALIASGPIAEQIQEVNTQLQQLALGVMNLQEQNVATSSEISSIQAKLAEIKQKKIELETLTQKPEVAKDQDKLAKLKRADPASHYSSRGA